MDLLDKVHDIACCRTLRRLRLGHPERKFRQLLAGLIDGVGNLAILANVLENGGSLHLGLHRTDQLNENETERVHISSDTKWGSSPLFWAGI
jgi:hypothetical protein